ncbi:glutaminyl-peptide cyclotransferase-like protein, partial [Dinothrombium tinctorium]
WHRKPKKLQEDEFTSLAEITSRDQDDFNVTLDELLRVRVPDTRAHNEVKQYIIGTMESLGWSVETDKFQSYTPHGRKRFTNIIATHNPDACKRLVFACHYDSKWTPSQEFVGAIDSAVPCAMLLNLVKSLDNKLQKQKTRDDITLQLIFFDGEEAFEDWTETDSLYGSRHLASKWNKLKFPRTENDKKCVGNYVSELDRIELFVLLDLLGSPNPAFYSYFQETNSLHQRLRRIETKLNDLKLLESHPPQHRTAYFRDVQKFSYIEDDHVPFVKKDVPVLHIIPNPFPYVWHTDNDNKRNLHYGTINNLMKIFKIFMVQYLHLTPIDVDCVEDVNGAVEVKVAVDVEHVGDVDEDASFCQKSCKVLIFVNN